MGTGRRKGGKVLEPFVREEGRAGTTFGDKWISLRGVMLIFVGDRAEGEE